MKIYIVCFALTIFMGSAASSEKVAFIVGMDNYPGVPLENAGRDARALKELCIRELGFDEQGVIFGLNLTEEEFFQKFEEFKKIASSAEIAVVFYAGHGMESLDGRENYLLPVDADITQASQSEAALRASGISLLSLTKELEQHSAAAKIVLVDACRQRPAGRGRSTTGGGLALYEDKQIPPETLIMLAASPKGLASDGDKHGPFTEALLEILPKKGGSLMELFFAVSDRVQEKTQFSQIPWLKFDGSGRIFRSSVFIEGPASAKMEIVGGQSELEIAARKATPPLRSEIFEGGLSPDGKWTITMPLKEDYGTRDTRNYLVSAVNGGMVAQIDGFGGREGMNHCDLVPKWSGDSNFLLWIVEGRFGQNAINLLEINSDSVSQINIYRNGKTEILERLRAARPDEYASVVKVNRSSGWALPDGFALWVDFGEGEPEPKFPLNFTFKVSSNPKAIASYENLDASLDGEISESGVFQWGNFQSSWAPPES